MKNKLSRITVCLALAMIGAGLSLPVAAQRGGGHGGGSRGGSGGHGGAGWHGGGGGWHGGGGHGWGGGGLGWWGPGLGLGLGWDLAAPYYYGYPYSGYPQPYSNLYPYPEEDYPYSVPAQEAPANPPPTSSWYYCDSAKDYYPRVAQCPEPWRTVPAVPSGPPQ